MEREFASYLGRTVRAYLSDEKHKAEYEAWKQARKEKKNHEQQQKKR